MSNWQERAKALIDARDAQIPKDWRLSAETIQTCPSNVFPIFSSCGILSPEELELTDPSQDATTLIAKLANGSITSEQLTLAFLKRAAIAQQLLNCLVDFFPDEALALARERDAYFRKHKKPIGPLHGLPISVKGHLALKGHDSGAGCSILAWAGKHIKDADAPWVGVLRDAGAVFYCRTSVPQAIMHLETSSFWGTTRNPYSTSTSPGGSSGGESALIAAGGSPMGLGGDIGGSLRGPAAFTGLWTLKTTNYRLPKAGATNSVIGNEAIVSSNGVIARSLRDVELFHRIQLDAKPWLLEPTTVRMPWNMNQDWQWSGKNGKIRVGVLRDDGFVTPVAPMLRAIDALRDAIEKDDQFEVVDFEPFKTKEIVDLAHSLYFTDGGDAVRKAAAESGEPLFPLTEFILNWSSVKKFTVSELWAQTAYREAMRMEVAANWVKHGIDVLLCPPTPGPAPKLETMKYWGYTNYWNVMDYPGVVFPTGLTASKDLDAQYKSPTSYRNEHEEFLHETYKTTEAEGLPLGVQIVGPRYTDERTLKAAMLIEEAWHRNG